MEYAKINLSKTNYSISNNHKIINDPNIDELNEIYVAYCRYKKFKSFIPIFDSQYLCKETDVVGYYDEGKLVAFSLLRKYDHENVEALQFAWNYENPKLHLGISSLRNECAMYKQLGFKYLYLGMANDYKKKFDGFEILGPA